MIRHMKRYKWIITVSPGGFVFGKLLDIHKERFLLKRS